MKSSISAVLLILQGLMNVLVSLFFLAIPDMIYRLAEEATYFLFSFFGVFFGLFVIVGILQIIAGIGIMSSAQWAWGFGIGVSIVGLFSFPIGTVLAIVCILVLSSSREEFGVKREAGASSERNGDEEWPLVLGTIVVVIGILWVLAAYVRTPYAWAMAFGVIGIALMILGSVLKTQVRSLAVMGEIFLGIGVFVVFFVSGIRADYLAVPIIVGGLLIILAHYVSRKNREAGRFIAVICIAAVIGAVCAPLYPEGGSIRVGWDRSWIDIGGWDGMGKEYTVSDTKYLEPKGMLSIETTGSIAVRGWNESRIKLGYTKLSSEESLLDEIRVDIQESAGELRVITETTGSREWEAVDYDVMVPRSSLDLHLVSDYGNIVVEGVNCTLDAKTEYGDMRLVDIRGRTMEIDTDYGDITIERAIGDMKAKTGYGDMKLNDAEGSSANIETDYGDIEVEGCAFESFIAQTGYGDVETDIREIGNITLKTSYGDVRVRAPEYRDVRVVLKTSGGDIDVRIPLVTERTSENEFVGYAGSSIHRIEVEVTSGDIRIE